VAGSAVKAVYPLTVGDLDSTDRKVKAVLLSDYLSDYLGDNLQVGTQPIAADVLVCTLQPPAQEDTDSAFINKLKSRTKNYAACTESNLVSVAARARAIGTAHVVIVSATPFHENMGALAQIMTKQESEVAALDWQTVTIIRTVVPYAVKHQGSWLQRFGNLWQRQLEYMVPDKHVSLTSKEIAQAVRQVVVARADPAINAVNHAPLQLLSALDLRALVKPNEKGALR
jgi:hypothetical protein